MLSLETMWTCIRGTIRLRMQVNIFYGGAWCRDDAVEDDLDKGRVGGGCFYCQGGR
jgi:hypothetical protein